MFSIHIHNWIEGNAESAEKCNLPCMSQGHDLNDVKKRQSLQLVYERPLMFPKLFTQHTVCNKEISS